MDPHKLFRGVGILGNIPTKLLRRATRWVFAAVVSMLLSVAGQPQLAFAQSACGGEGQRACCIGTLEYANSGGPCNVGVFQETVTGCTDPNGCTCGGDNLISTVVSSGMCVALSSCGGVGQRACCVGEGSACQAGLQQINACDDSSGGNCFCSSGTATSLGTCVQPTACGGLGQRACCTGNLESASGTTLGSCQAGYVAIPGCSGDCTCGGTAIVPNNIVSVDTCTLSPIETIREPTIAAIATPSSPQILPSSPPIAYVDPADPLRGYADLHVHMFAHLAHGGATVAGTPYDPSCPASTPGAAGTVTEGLGGTCPTEVSSGTGGVNTALRQDYGTAQALTDKNGQSVPLDPNACAGYLNGIGSSQDANINNFVCNNGSDAYTLHGSHSFNTITGGGTNDAAASNFGAPVFNGWPQANSTIHQQVYYKWLERAWMGGLRLITMFAVTNESLCKSSSKMAGTDCTDSMTAIDAQLQAAKDFQVWLDNQNGGPGNGWFQIVKSPAEAKAAIQKGKLAVVLGIEVDHLFNCHMGADTGTAVEGTVGLPAVYGNFCTPAYIDAQVQKYYDLGVRHVFPVHNFDNAYGSPAAWQDAINAGNYAAEGAWWTTEACSNNSANPLGYGFWLDPLIESTALLLGFNSLSDPNYLCGLNADGSTPAAIELCSAISPGYASCNAKGMTSLGLHLVDQLIAHNMIIDVDHLSTRSLDQVLTKAETQSPPYPGIVASHVQFFDLYKEMYNPPNTGNYGRHERMRTSSQLARIKNLGGMIAVMLKDDAQDTQNGYCAPGSALTTLCEIPGLFPGLNSEGGKFTVDLPSLVSLGVTNDCRYSTTEWYQAYREGVALMGGPVAMGSDFNGIAGHVGPRFGAGACGGDPTERSHQEKAAQLSPGTANYRARLQYPFTLQGFGTFDKQVSGERTFDFNTDGLAHIGLVPDMIADLYNVDPNITTGTNGTLEPLFHSASAYVSMWQNTFSVTQFTVIPASNTWQFGIQNFFIINAYGPQSQQATNYNGTLHLTAYNQTTGVTTTLPDFTLSAGTGTPYAAFSVPGVYTVTATDAYTGLITGTSSSFVVSPPSSNASLGSLTVSSGSLSPAFAAGTLSYTDAVANSVNSISVTPTLADSTANVNVNGVASDSGFASTPIALAVGTNTITVAVTAQDGKTKLTYTIVVTRAPLGSNASLSNLYLSNSALLSPAFASGTLSYTAAVASSVNAISVTATLADSAATLTLNGVSLGSGQHSNDISLSLGPNTITVATTAADGTTKLTYTIVVTRAPSSNASLSSLAVSSGSLSPAFAAGTLAYTDAVANSVTSITVTPTLADSTATVTVNGTSAASGVASPAIALSVGVNTITVSTTAQDGTTTQTYTISVSRSLAAQIITFGATPSLVAGGTAVVSATGGASGNPVTFSASPATVCTVTGSTVAASAVGTCTVTANQAGNAAYFAAAPISLAIAVGAGSQTIVFASAPAVVVGGSGTLAANGGASGNPVIFASITPATCSVAGSTVTGVTAGTCVVSANQAASTNYTAAPQVTQTIAINQPPAFTNAAATTFTALASGAFSFTATGAPAPGFSTTSALPAGVTLTPSGLLGGTPASNTQGTYPLVITASNSVGSAAQAFTLTVVAAPSQQCHSQDQRELQAGHHKNSERDADDRDTGKRGTDRDSGRALGEHDPCPERDSEPSSGHGERR